MNFSILLFLCNCSALDSFLYADLDRQESLIASDPSFYHEEARSERSSGEERYRELRGAEERALQVCRGEIRLNSLSPFTISDGALVCGLTGGLQRSQELFDLATRKASGIDRRKIMLNRLIMLHRLGMDILDADLAPVLTDLSHTRALELVQGLEVRRQDYLADRIYSFMIPRSNGAALADVLLAKGIYDDSRGRTGLAVTALQKSIELRDNHRAREILGSIYLQSRDYNRAILNLQKAYERKPDTELAFRLARAFMGRKDYEKALQWIRKADGSKADVIQLHGKILLSMDVSADPRSLLSSLKRKAGSPCLASNASMQENLHYCGLQKYYDAIRPIRRRSHILRDWFGTSRPENRKELVPLIQGHY
ncbi:MAG: hypothetical protein KDK25_09655 [Leptospiraceae bacterium]|nr:hypothetical protein [Leptospiraceae bacterium]